MYTHEGYVMPITSIKQAAVKQPTRLIWEVEEPLKLKIQSAIKHNQNVC